MLPRSGIWHWISRSRRTSCNFKDKRKQASWNEKKGSFPNLHISVHNMLLNALENSHQVTPVSTTSTFTELLNFTNAGKENQNSKDDNWSDFQMPSWTPNSNIYRMSWRKIPTWYIVLTYQNVFTYLPKETTFIYRYKNIMPGPSIQYLPKVRLTRQRNKLISKTWISCLNLYIPFLLPI